MGEAQKLGEILVADGHRASRTRDCAAQILRKALALGGPRRRNQGTLTPTRRSMPAQTQECQSAAICRVDLISVLSPTSLSPPNTPRNLWAFSLISRLRPQCADTR
jgi:hypothetical protein